MACMKVNVKERMEEGKLVVGYKNTLVMVCMKEKLYFIFCVKGIFQFLWQI
jgi:hypothetical protein